MKSLADWARQPTTVAGLSAILGTFVALLLHQLSLGAALPLLAGGITSILLPDNSVAKQDAQSFARDVVADVITTKGTSK